jgi:hypothetical protein
MVGTKGVRMAKLLRFVGYEKGWRCTGLWQPEEPPMVPVYVIDY